MQGWRVRGIEEESRLHWEHGTYFSKENLSGKTFKQLKWYCDSRMYLLMMKKKDVCVCVSRQMMCIALHIWNLQLLEIPVVLWIGRAWTTQGCVCSDSDFRTRSEWCNGPPIIPAISKVLLANSSDFNLSLICHSWNFSCLLTKIERFSEKTNKNPKTALPLHVQILGLEVPLCNGAATESRWLAGSVAWRSTVIFLPQ